MGKTLLEQICGGAHFEPELKNGIRRGFRYNFR
jgi:hypothetical protein